MIVAVIIAYHEQLFRALLGVLYNIWDALIIQPWRVDNFSYFIDGTFYKDIDAFKDLLFLQWLCLFLFILYVVKAAYKAPILTVVLIMLALMVIKNL